jgi:hypothetical protein
MPTSIAGKVNQLGLGRSEGTGRARPEMTTARGSEQCAIRVAALLAGSDLLAAVETGASASGSRCLSTWVSPSGSRFPAGGPAVGAVALFGRGPARISSCRPFGGVRAGSIPVHPSCAPVAAPSCAAQRRLTGSGAPTTRGMGDPLAAARRSEVRCRRPCAVSRGPAWRSSRDSGAIHVAAVGSGVSLPKVLCSTRIAQVLYSTGDELSEQV